MLRVAPDAMDVTTLEIGESVAHDGACLTVVGTGPGWFEVEASRETMARTTLGDMGAGARVHLERALRLGDRLGGHLVQGHVDGVGVVQRVVPQGPAKEMVVRIPGDLTRYVAAKGSLAVDGVSLTVNRVQGDLVTLTVIPHTGTVTKLGALEPGSRVNLETDVLAKYVVAALQHEDRGGPAPGEESLLAALETGGFM